ncbi:NAD-dependent epimerase/dehydratase family protein [Palleronia sediminis]|uniref:NAD-dependent epimerase/dehydratase family protein n=1 Tax=Palleronia sediminis TaxID=2547833 RepID=A0A4R5ZVE7_9RHOB|nr:NAD(P)H-binding protein [Palleronia sediminis]TDL74224.1 NAD-dependent epimerase/dehydratase family protein [Palleronia sediminis]
MTEIKTVAVFGASGRTGRHFTRMAVERGLSVRAFEPDWTGIEPPDPQALLAQANLLDGDLRGALKGCDAVVSCIGVGLSAKSAIDPPPLYTEGAVRMIEGMRANDIRRLVVISASFVEARDRGPSWFRLASSVALERIFTQMGEMERILRAASTDIDWTAVRPGWLMDAPFTGDYTVAPNAIPEGTIRTRHADLAHFMLDCLMDGTWIHATPAIARPEEADASSPARMLREVAG